MGYLTVKELAGILEGLIALENRVTELERLANRQDTAFQIPGNFNRLSELCTDILYEKQFSLKDVAKMMGPLI